MIIGAAFTPHSPLLLPTISPSPEFCLKTRLALSKISAEICGLLPDTIVIFSEHGNLYSESFSGGLHDPFIITFREFGDHETKFTTRPDLALADTLQRHLRREEIPFTFDTDENLSYGAGVPLFFLRQLLSSTRLLPLSPSLLNFKAHFNFGIQAGEIFSASQRKIFLLASGDLSHHLSSDSPAGYRPEGLLFNAELKKLLLARNTTKLLTLDTELVERVGECALRPLLMLLGAIERFSYVLHLESDEINLGTGYLSVRFNW